MNGIKQFFAVSLLLLSALYAHAQYETSPKWIFGHDAGLDFTNPGNPVPISSPMAGHSARSATQCDAQGNIMFYSNGVRIWNKNGVEMFASMNPLYTSYNTSWSIDTRIVPHPIDTNKYYVFNIFPSNGTPPWNPVEGTGQLTYTIVDMSMNGGLGGVVPGTSYTLLDNNVGNYMLVLPDDKCNLWLVVHTGIVHQFTFKSYRINGQGLQATPVVSPIGFIPSCHQFFPYGPDNRNGNMIYSYTRNKILVSYNSIDLYGYDFNKTTGAVSNPKQLITVQDQAVAGISFSPDESLLYTCGYILGCWFILQQYPVTMTGGNIGLGPSTVIVSANNTPIVFVDEITGYMWCETNMALGPDDKIYVATNWGQNRLGRIENPNTLGIACNFDPYAITLQPNTYSTNALPGPITRRSSQDTLVQGTKKDTTVCFQPSVLLTAPDASYTSYLWQNGNTGQTYSATQSGIYTVVASKGCTSRTDTFDVQLENFELSLGTDVAICEPFTLQPITNATPPVSYLWQDGSTGKELYNVMPGEYWVKLNKNGCEKTDTVEILPGKVDVIFGNDTTICIGKPLTLTAYNDGATYLWQDGSTAANFVVSQPGTYYVAVEKGFCEDADTITVKQVLCDCDVVLPSAFSPNSDGKNDFVKPILPIGCPIKYFSLNIYNRWGELLFSSINPTDKWDGTYKGTVAEVGSYMYHMEYASGSEDRKSLKGDITLVR